MASQTITTTFSTIANVEKSGSPGTWNWQNVNNAKVQDTNISDYYPDGGLTGFPSFGTNYLTDYLFCTDIASKVPAGATIFGIKVRIRKSADASGKGSFEYIEATDTDIILYYNGNAISDNKANTSTPWSNSLTYDDYGSSVDTWNINSPNTTIINDSSFGIRIAAKYDFVNQDKVTILFGVEYVEIQISYSSDVGPYAIGSNESINPAIRNRIAAGNVNVNQTTVPSAEASPKQALRSNTNQRPIPSAEQVPNPSLRRSINQNNTGTVPSAQIIPSPKLVRNINQNTIPSQELVNITVLKQSINQRNNNTIPSVEIVEIPGLRQNITQRNTIPSTEIVPVPKLVSVIRPVTIVSEELVSPQFKITRNIYPQTITSAETIDLHEIINQETFIYPETIENIDIGYHALKFQQLIIPEPIDDNTDPPSDHELIKPSTHYNFYNQIYSPAYEMGYFDCLALGRDINIDPHYDLSFNNLNTDYLFSVQNLELNYKQNANFDKRLAGEGASPNTFKIDTREYSLSFKMPLKVESWGYVDPAFSALYDYCIQGYKGNSTSFIGRVKSDTSSAIGSTTFMKIDNIADFMALGTNFTAYIRSDDDSETTETITVSSVNKSERRLYFANPTVYSHTPAKTYIWTTSTNPASNREPSFSLFSLREGLFSGCMVDSISLSISPANNIIADINIKFTNLDRKYQKNFLTDFDTIVNNVNNRRPNYLLSSSLVRLEFSDTDLGYFGLGRATQSKLFRGFQEYDIRDFEINEMSLTISNNLQAVYSLNAKSNNQINDFNKNLQPFAHYSNGRSITGSITYSSPIKPWLFAEKLSGISSINKNGIRFNFGPFELNLPEIVWTPESSSSSVENVQTKKLSWSVVNKTLVFEPYLSPTGQY
jgi:hypothetical protein